MQANIRKLIEVLESVGFINKGGKDGHRNFQHPNGIKITIGGNLSEEAKQYQIKDVKRATELIGD